MEPEKNTNGAFVGLAVIIIILVIGGIYIWISNQKAQEQLQNSQTQSENVTSQDAATLNALEQDSKKTNTDTGVDASTVR